MAFGVSALYLVVFLASLIGAALLIEPSLFARTVGHPVNVLGLPAAGLAGQLVGTIGGALGVTLETDEAVREAAYAHRPS